MDNLAKLRILLVDDSEDDVFMARTVFAQLGLPHELRTAGSAQDALACLYKASASNPACLPDLLLLDINMPSMNGFMLLKELKGDQDLRRIPVIMLTTSNSPADIRRSYECGAASYLTKPNDLPAYKELFSNFWKYWMLVSALPQ